MEIKEYDTWFELYGYDGVQWEFICDGETHEQMAIVANAPEGPADSYEHFRIKRCEGQA